MTAISVCLHLSASSDHQQPTDQHLRPPGRPHQTFNCGTRDSAVSSFPPSCTTTACRWR